MILIAKYVGLFCFFLILFTILFLFYRPFWKILHYDRALLTVELRSIVALIFAIFPASGGIFLLTLPFTFVSLSTLTFLHLTTVNSLPITNCEIQDFYLFGQKAKQISITNLEKATLETRESSNGQYQIFLQSDHQSLLVPTF